jgi:hypothetical protein
MDGDFSALLSGGAAVRGGPRVVSVTADEEARAVLASGADELGGVYTRSPRVQRQRVIHVCCTLRVSARRRLLHLPEYDC